MESKFPLMYPDILLRAAVFIDAEANTALQIDALGITFTQYRILQNIADGATVQAAVAHILAVSHPAMSRHVKNLEADKLITRTINADMRREHHLELTKRGEALRKRAEQVLSKHLRKTLAPISSSARTSAMTTLQKTINACAHNAE